MGDGHASILRNYDDALSIRVLDMPICVIPTMNRGSKSRGRFVYFAAR